MKAVNLLTVLLPLVLFNSASLQAHDEPVKTTAEKAEREKARLKMERLSIESQKIWVVTPGGSGKVNDSTLYVRNRYDHSGNITEQWVFEGSDSTLSLSLYDKANEWLEEVSFVRDSLVDRTLFVYGIDGLIRQILSYDNLGQLTDRLDYYGQPHKDTIVAEKLNAADSLMYRITYAYEPGSEMKRLIEARQTNGDGSLKVRMRNRFEGNLRTEKQVFGSSDSLGHLFNYTYTSSGDFAEIVKKTPENKVSMKQTFEYRADGLVQRMIERDGSGVTKRTICYAYNKHGE